MGRWRGPSRLQFPEDLKVELFPLHSPLLRESLLVSFPPLSYMLKFSGSSYLISGQRMNGGWGAQSAPLRGLPLRQSHARAPKRWSGGRLGSTLARARRTGECRPKSLPHRARSIRARVLGACGPIAWAAFASLRLRDSRPVVKPRYQRAPRGAA